MRMLYKRPQQTRVMLADHSNPYLVETQFHPVNHLDDMAENIKHRDSMFDKIKRRLWSKTNPRNATVIRPNKTKNTTKQNDEYTKMLLETNQIWDTLLARGNDTHTHKGLLARQQDDLYYRCHYKHSGHVYTCICKERPVVLQVTCRIEPAGQGPHDWDLLATIIVPRTSDDVLWDTDYNEITDATRDRIGMDWK